MLCALHMGHRQLCRGGGARPTQKCLTTPTYGPHPLLIIHKGRVTRHVVIVECICLAVHIVNCVLLSKFWESPIAYTLQWLLTDNIYYHNIRIDPDTLALLPEDGDLCSMTLGSSPDDQELPSP